MEAEIVAKTYTEVEEKQIKRPLKELIINSIIDTKEMFLSNLNKKLESNMNTEYKMNLKINDEYKYANINEELLKTNVYTDKLFFRKEMQKSNNQLNKSEIENQDITISPVVPDIEQKITKIINPEKKQASEPKTTSLVKLTQEEEKEIFSKIPEKYRINSTTESTEGNVDNLVLSLYKNQNHISFRKQKLVTPEWHPKWKLYRVISGHSGWVRCIDVDPTNQWFVTGSNDRVIKFWDLAKGKLKLSLTGHINTVRSVIISPRHPYLFSCGEDKMIKCWDLEQNKVVRHYHGHLSGIYKSK